MNKARNKSPKPELRGEYGFTGGLRGKYVRRHAQGTNVVVLEPDVAKAFPNAAAVNNSLRSLVGTVHRRRKILAAK